jgi:2-oxoglutarate ferredoxin oxidoreductase subunit delta
VAQGEIVINEELCLGCGYCENFCPQKCIVISNKTNSSGMFLSKFEFPEKCNACGICSRLCPHYAIDVYRKVEAKA